MTITKILTTTIVIAGVAISTTSSAGAARPATHAVAELRDPSGAVVGAVRLVEDGDGRLHVRVATVGLEPGDHGIHIHSIGSCSPTFAAAGGHHNPSGLPHGQHAGDLPNLSVNAARQGHMSVTTEAATLSNGPSSVFDADGSAVVVHALADDFVGQPAGNSGARIACGVIGLEP